jgi:GT2 family glycosyltransferase
MVSAPLPSEPPPPRPTVVAIVVNYRTPRLAIDCVESLLRSMGVVPQVIVIDNASGDDSVALLRASLDGRPGVSVRERRVNDGYTGANNAGYEMAREMGARFALVLNSDTVVSPDCVERLVDEMERDERTALVHPRIFYGDAPDRLWFGGSTFSLWTGCPVHVGLHRTEEHGWREARDLPYATGCALLVRMDAVESPLFDASLFAYAEDLDLSLRLRERRWRIRYVPEAIVWHHEGSSHRSTRGQSLRLYLNTRNLLRVVSRHARWYHWPVLAPMLAVNVVGRFAALALRQGNVSGVVSVLRGSRDAITGGRHAVETA